MGRDDPDDADLRQRRSTGFHPIAGRQKRAQILDRQPAGPGEEQGRERLCASQGRRAIGQGRDVPVHPDIVRVDQPRAASHADMILQGSRSNPLAMGAAPEHD
jgi:hypothetical protein